MNTKAHFNLHAPSTILIIGMAGGLARITAELLLKTYPEVRIIGVDARTPKEKIHNPKIEYITMRYNRSSFEKLFRSQKFDAILHLGRMGHISFGAGKKLKKRIDLNVIETGRILELGHKFGAKKAIVLSTYHVYGALPDNQAFIEEDAPLKASIKYPELRDVVEMDQVATNDMWKHQNEMQAIVLRPCSIIGPQIKNAMSNYLTSSLAPAPLDFNPMFQFVHEFDMAWTIIKCLEKAPTGIYNVAPDEPVSIVDAKKIIHPQVKRLPITLLEFLIAPLFKSSTLKIPHYMIEYVKFPCLISNKSLKKALNENPFRYSSKEAVELLRLGLS